MKVSHFLSFLCLVACTSVAPNTTISSNVANKPERSFKLSQISTIDKKLQDFYWEHRNRFEFYCQAKETDPVTFRLYRSSNEDTVFFGQTKTTMSIVYPDEELAHVQLTPEPHFFTNIKSYSEDGFVTKRKEKITLKEWFFLEMDKRRFRCILTTPQSTPVSLYHSDSQLVHLSVHPHGLFDPTGKLIDKLEPYLLDEDIRTYVFLEGYGMPYYMVKAANSEAHRTDAFWDPERDVNLKELGNASLHIAPRGIFKFKYTEGSNFPNRILFTGGHLSECVAWLIANVCETFLLSSNRQLDVILPMPLLIPGRALKETRDPDDIVKILTEEMKRIGRVLHLKTGELSFYVRPHNLGEIQKKNLRQYIKQLPLSAEKAPVSKKQKSVVFSILMYDNSEVENKMLKK